MNIVILDTGCANLASVAYAIKRLCYTPEISRNIKTILQADKVFLPGVGTASAAMKKLHERELVSLIKILKQPVLGICLGMQLMGSFSEEGNIPVPLLGLIDSPVQKIETKGLPIPHSGWNQVQFLADNPLFKDIRDGTYFYFVHSYSMPISVNTIAKTQYGNVLSSAVNQKNFYGVQFHPERSGAAGSRLIQNFLEM
ncbi:Imidazole glycerol phosphate synthase subunit HisH [Candidatus Hartigia pinicola]|nr:Imidazole glycerol phosphate synthase subunit HisH [Candidatus Hartigia pinicola]